jgi:ribosomal protein S18 acetylase RimI-like enzyme
LRNGENYSKLRERSLFAQFVFGRKMRIRTFDLDRDYASVRRLWESCAPGIQISPTDDYVGIQHKLERDPELFLVAVEGDEIVGSVFGGYDGRRGIVYHLAVPSEYRRQGIAKSLMETLEQRLHRLGCYKYYLLVTSENDEALAFYDSIGCERMDLYVLGKVIS